MAGVKTSTVMNMQHFHDFYFLQAMEASVKMEIIQNPDLEFQKPVEKFLDDLDKTVDNVVPNMAARTMMYLWAASFGEARHAKDTVARNRFLSVKLRAARNEWFSNAVNYEPTPSNVAALKEIFAQEWRSGYGGEAWGNIVQAIADYKKTPPAAWIDHVVDLEHNNGTAFSKPDGEGTIYFSVYYPDRFGAFLDYKFRKDILVKPPSFTTQLEVTPKIHSLLTRYSKLFNKPEVKHVNPSLDPLTDYVVEWGDGTIEVGEKWADWAMVGRDNKPHVQSLLNSAGLYDFYAGYFTKEQFLEKVEHVEKRALGKLSEKFSTNYMKGKIKKTIAKFVERNVGKCKINKAPTTYKVIPCKVVKQSTTKVKVFIPLPHQKGYGEQGDGGFTVEFKLFTDPIQVEDTYIEKRYGEVVLWVQGTYHYVSSAVLEALID